VLTDEHGFSEAEAALRGACAAAEILCDSALEHRAHRALARCLYWQRRYDEALATLSAVRRERDGDAGAAESEALRSRIAAAQGDLRLAVMAAAKAIQHADRTDEDRLVASAAKATAIAQVAVGDDDQARRWAERGLARSARAHLPVVSLRLRALAVGADLRSGGKASAAIDHVRTALRRPELPALVRAELESGFEPSTAVKERRGFADRTLRDLETFLSVVHAAPDDASGLEALCREVADATRATTVQVVTGSPSPRMLARTGRPWQAELSTVDGVLAGAECTSADAMERSRCAATTIRFGQEAIAVLCCRWTPGTAIDGAGALARMKAAALAAASAVRSALDRAHVSIADVVAGDLLGASHAAIALRDAMARAARAPFPVLIEGESGSGKELVARGIHRLGSRRDRRLCAVNCAALTDDLLEAELFGHARGAFTGAVGERPGLFEEADGGTLFLDEVGELSARAQAKLLRVLQDGEVRRVGENFPRKVDARIIAATNRRLDEEVAASRFRGDLKFRLDVVRLIVPPLRDRASDIPALASHFWNDAASRVGSSATFTPDTLAALARYDWPGNVRELQNAIASIAVHAPRRGRVVPSMLPAHIARAARSNATTFEAAREDFERRYVRAALAQAAGHRTRAARSLGVSRQGLAKMLRRLGIDS
jgi:DNA-binding NtrC family response regulator/predicted negative regulator of RcsB-dependent stress response